jgi:CubicO group peptidase (beta-lactamase class C family)
MAESTTPSAANAEYGYLWWLSGAGDYSASGIFGQGIYISPKTNLVIAVHSAREHASRPEDWVLQKALYKAVDKALSK